MWYIRNIDFPCNGPDFKSIEKEMQSQLEFIIPKEVQQNGRSHESGKSFNLSKGDFFLIPDTKELVCGLGWDTGNHDMVAFLASYLKKILKHHFRTLMPVHAFLILRQKKEKLFGLTTRKMPQNLLN